MFLVRIRKKEFHLLKKKEDEDPKVTTLVQKDRTANLILTEALGACPLQVTQVRMDEVLGHYPNSTKYPLKVTQVRMDKALGRYPSNTKCPL